MKKITWARVKIILVVALAILGVVLMATNSKTVGEAEHIWFFGEWNLPVWHLVIITLVIGFVAGVLLGSRMYEKSSEEEREERQPRG